jgi:hypothetical protein
MRSLTVVGTPVLAAGRFVRQVSEAALLALRAVAWPIEGPRIAGEPIVAGIAERRSVPQP